MTRSVSLQKIISGGQTGVDRAALDAALMLDFPCGGWCPEGRRAEDGRIPDHYPLRELAGGYRRRTLQNVIASDATAVIYFAELDGGTELTVAACVRKLRPYRLINGEDISARRGALMLSEWVAGHAVGTLNVAGPRLSKSPKAYAYTYELISIFLADYCGNGP